VILLSCHLRELDQWRGLLGIGILILFLEALNPARELETSGNRNSRQAFLMPKQLAMNADRETRIKIRIPRLADPPVACLVP
jgi:hypothetical protein